MIHTESTKMGNTKAQKISQAKANPRNGGIFIVLLLNKGIKNSPLLEMEGDNVMKKRFNSPENFNFSYFQEPNKRVSNYTMQKLTEWQARDKNVPHSGDLNILYSIKINSGCKCSKMVLCPPIREYIRI